MTPEQLAKRLATQRPEVAGPSPDCPDEHLLAAYVDGNLGDTAARPLERHLADCGYCLELVALLAGEREAEGATHARLETASSPAASMLARSRRWHGVQKWAAAAALVLAVPLLFQLGGEEDRLAEGRGGTEAPGRRMAEKSVDELQVLSPVPGTAVNPRAPTFVWTEVPGTPYYDLRIVTDEGDVVVEQRVNGTRWQPALPLALSPGADYFVLVEAYPSGDKAISSHHVPFRIPE